ncbi:MAG: DUF1016 domain-containing protein [Desulfobacteraceae bacterium]|nr:DUF1016 domain-containing protein [Desulfobacteraceae bacterium]MBC2720605.1 hypothetical protein [Desulfobacteraceae bacterium]
MGVPLYGPNIKGFSARNIWTMKQFYETYQQDEKLPSLMAELSWTHNRRIMSLKTASGLQIISSPIYNPHR